MRSILRRRWDNLAQYQILLGWVGAPLLALDLAIQLLTGLTGPAVVLGMGLAVDAARREGAALAQALALTGAGLVLQQVLAPLQVWVAAEVAQRAGPTHAPRQPVQGVPTGPQNRGTARPALA